MGNKLGRNRQVVDERFTRPQGLYVNKDVDIKKLKKLILESKLAPCYPGDDECCRNLEECPICFLYYPSLNRSRCCMKSICTECFLQMKNPNSTCLIHMRCPFCKTSNYAVEYRGVKTQEEKDMEQIEEQRVIEAKIRMRQKELLDDEERTQKQQESCCSSASVVTADVEYGLATEGGEIVSRQNSSAASTLRQLSRPRANRDDEFDVDLEDIMVMEAIWLSIRESGRRKDAALSDICGYGGQHITEDRYISPSMAMITGSSSSLSSSAPSGGLACAIAALAEHQQTVGESSDNHSRNTSSFDMLPDNCTDYYNTIDRDVEYNNCLETNNCLSAHTSVHLSLDMAKEGSMSYASSDMAEDTPCGISRLRQSEEVSGTFQSFPPAAPSPPIVPESFEEQMMLAMAVSLAEVHAATSGPSGSAWQ